MDRNEAGPLLRALLESQDARGPLSLRERLLIIAHDRYETPDAVQRGILRVLSDFPEDAS